MKFLVKFCSNKLSIYIEKKIAGVSKMPKMCLRIGPHQNTAGP